MFIPVIGALLYALTPCHMQILALYKYAFDTSHLLGECRVSRVHPFRYSIDTYSPYAVSWI